VLFIQPSDPAKSAEPTPALEELVSPEIDASLPLPDSPQERQSRVTLFGRVGAGPRFRTTPKGRLVASFPLAVRESEEQTTWHTIVAFDKRAEQVRESLAKGQALEVIGYLHQRERQLRDGRTKRIEQIYAVAIRPR
jgi:single-strand DNA-binding protein